MMEFKVLLLLLVILATVIALPLPQDDGGVDLGLDGARRGLGGLERGKKHGSKGGNGRGDKGDIEFGADKSGLEGEGDLAFGRKRGGKRSKSGRGRNDDES